MSTANFDYVKNLVYKLSEREQRKLLNSLSWRLGITRTQAQDIPSDDDDGDYKIRIEAFKQAEKESYKHKIELVKQIINKGGKEAELFDLMARPIELHKLLDILTYGQIGRLNFFGLARMLRITTQSRDSTNPTAYILSSYKNLIDSKDYKARWEKQRKAEQEQQRAESLIEFDRHYAEDMESLSKTNILGGAQWK